MNIQNLKMNILFLKRDPPFKKWPMYVYFTTVTLKPNALGLANQVYALDIHCFLGFCTIVT